MKTDSLDIYGSVTIERLSSLPVWDSSYVGRMIFNISDDTLYIGKASGFEVAGGTTGFGGLDWNPDENTFLEVVVKSQLSTTMIRHGASPVTSGIFWSQMNLYSYVSNVSSTALSFDMDITENIIVAGCSRGNLFYTTNAGELWTRVTPVTNDSQGYWTSISCTDDGSKFFAGHSNFVLPDNGVYLSTDYGQNWTKKLNTSSGVSCIACDSTGKTVIACSNRLYVSTNGGDNWTEVKPSGDAARDWYFVDCSDDGNFLMAGIRNATTGRIWISNNGGLSWSETRPAGDASFYWTRGCCSSDGINLMVSKYGNIYRSTNGGTSWVSIQSNSVEAYVACDSIGNNLIMAGDSYDPCYISNDAGSSWNPQNWFKSTNKDWRWLKVNDDATKYYALDNYGRFYSGEYGTKTGNALLYITPYDLIQSVRGGKPPYKYSIKRSGSTYASYDLDPKVPTAYVSCGYLTSEIPPTTIYFYVSVFDATNTYVENYCAVSIYDLYGNCPV